MPYSSQAGLSAVASAAYPSATPSTAEEPPAVTAAFLDAGPAPSVELRGRADDVARVLGTCVAEISTAVGALDRPHRSTEIDGVALALLAHLGAAIVAAGELASRVGDVSAVPGEQPACDAGATPDHVEVA
ncbi:hypothetical protein [Georgenia alba]|uniref:Uncharacterized protein n=1 Tax=Georgenia alba TaxID=2233858 RepID=A0ABW2QBZ1_9MICO